MGQRLLEKVRRQSIARVRVVLTDVSQIKFFMMLYKPLDLKENTVD